MLVGAEPLETGVVVAVEGAGTTVVITRLLTIFRTVTTGRLGLYTLATLAPRAGSLPWASWYERKTRATRKSAAEAMKTRMAGGLRLFMALAWSVILSSGAVVAFATF